MLESVTTPDCQGLARKITAAAGNRSEDGFYRQPGRTRSRAARGGAVLDRPGEAELPLHGEMERETLAENGMETGPAWRIEHVSPRMCCGLDVKRTCSTPPATAEGAHPCRRRCVRNGGFGGNCAPVRMLTGTRTRARRSCTEAGSWTAGPGKRTAAAPGRARGVTDRPRRKGRGDNVTHGNSADCLSQTGDGVSVLGEGKGERWPRGQDRPVLCCFVCVAKTTLRFERLFTFPLHRCLFARECAHVRVYALRERYFAFICLFV